MISFITYWYYCLLIGESLILCALLGYRLNIKWMKAGKELDPAKFPITHTDGVITIEVINAQPSDSGKYKCIATNDLGSDATDCVVIVEGTLDTFI